MTHTTKWIVGVLIVLVLVGAVCVAGVVGFVYYIYKGTESSEYQTKQVEGREFGKTTDQAGCMKEGLRRAKGIRLLEIRQAMNNEVFVEECLKSASPTSGFCDGVPGRLSFQDSEWTKKQCQKAGMDEMQTSCTTVFHARLSYCQNLK